MNRLKMVFMPKISLTLSWISLMCCSTYLEPYIFECINLSVQDLFLSELLQANDFSGPGLRSWSFRFCVSIFLLAFYPCIVYPHIGDLTNLAGYPPLTKYHLLWFPPWPQPVVENGSSIQGRLQDGANIEEFKYLSKEKYFQYLPYLSPLCLRMGNV
jgi:hypothetical protein